MLDPDWVFTRPILWVALFALVGLLVLRTIRRDRREYQRFKRYRTTARRQKMLRRWLLDSFLMFGGASVVLLLLAGAFVMPLLETVQQWPVVRDIRGWFDAAPVLAWGIVIGLALAVVIATLIGLRAARSEESVPSIGDISAMLPRNRQELVIGGLLSVNAGVVEELMFRLALPALIFGASGSAVVAVFGSILIFGVLHLYQGVVGVVGTGIVGAIFMLLYLVSGSIFVPIVLHALFDLRSLVLIPIGVYEVHKVDGRVTRIISPLKTADATSPASAPGSSPPQHAA